MGYNIPTAPLYCLALSLLLVAVHTTQTHISSPLSLAVSHEGNIAVHSNLQVEIMRGEDSAVEREVKNYKKKVRQVIWTTKRGLLVVTEDRAYIYDEENRQIGTASVRNNSFIDVYEAEEEQVIYELEQKNNTQEFYENKHYNSLEVEKQKYITYVLNKTLTGPLYYLNGRKSVLVVYDNNQLEAVKTINEGKQVAQIIGKVTPPLPIQRIQTAPNANIFLISSTTDYALYSNFKLINHWKDTNYTHSCLFESGLTVLANSQTVLLFTLSHKEKQVKVDKGQLTAVFCSRQQDLEIVYLLMNDGEIIVVDGQSGGIGFAVLGTIGAVGLVAAGVKIYKSSKATTVARDGRQQMGDEQQARYAQLQNVVPNNDIRAPLRGD